ncbi:hypothetical protein JNX00_07280 [Hydrogenophaga sp. YM1]|uniref:hypothetical protein n=1 Tax=Hydrogenophaga sp. YM1 TaxID=2806262 RepID=UPI00195A4770|nr:hypothetical protein [Hydrogenophaga sp. YM1]QRR35655.1 hypothetical protein JNX00_07280 [Hydrogenophaga sp. YM1]
MAKISVNKLAEMLVTTSPTRRRRIVFDQKHPSANIVARYRQAVEPVASYLTNGRDLDVLKNASRVLRADGSGTAWSIEDKTNTADALERFAEFADQLPGDATYSQGPHDAAKLLIAGVSVSVRPDFLLTLERRRRLYVGALKLHYIKNPESALNRAGAEYVAVLLHEWLRQYGPEGHTPLHSHCMSIDVFRRSVVHAPRSLSKRWDDITAACEEIAVRWPIL